MKLSPKARSAIKVPVLWPNAKISSSTPFIAAMNRWALLTNGKPGRNVQAGFIW